MGDPADDERTAAPTVDERRGSAPRPEPRRSDPPPNAERLAGDRYRVRDEIARGGMGRVVEANDTLLGRTVAVKQALATDSEALRRFARETRITARLEHPSIVPVHDAGVSPDGTPFYVMRKVTGRPLAELVAKTTTVAERLALVPHVVAAAHAVAHAHGRGIVHRDLKPANILVGDNGETVVIDWGLAKVIGEPDTDDPQAGAAPADAGGSLRTRIGTVFGTPGFMPPEQVRGEAVDARCDVYALGATLYYVLAKLPPHASDSADEMMVATAAGPPTPIAKHVAGVPPELSTIVDTALAYDGAARYADASALAEELQRFLTGQLVASHRYSRRARLVRFVRKNRVSVAIASIAVAALAIGGWIAIGRIVRERDRADEQARLATDHARDADARADDLLVQQASALVATNPTAAVAMVKQLRSPPERWERLWRRARAVAAGARSRGVAWGLRGPENAMSAAMSPHGKRFVAVSRDEIWLYDFPHGASRVLTTPDLVRRPDFSDDDHLLVFTSEGTIVFDLVAGTQRLLRGVAPRWTDASATTLYSIDSKDVVHATDLRDGTTITLLGGAKTQSLALSPDRKWLACVDDHRIAILATDAPLAPPLEIPSPQPIYFVAWADDSDHLAVGSLRKLGTLLRTAPKLVWYDHPGGYGYPGFAGKAPMVASGDLYALVGGRLESRAKNVQAADVHVGNFDALVVAAGNSLHVYESSREAELVAPGQSIARVGAARWSPYVAGVANGRVLVWNVHDVLARDFDLREVSSYYPVGDRDLLLGDQLMRWSWLDTRTRRIAEVDKLPPFVRVSSDTSNPAIAQGSTDNETWGIYVIERTGDRVSVEDMSWARMAVFDDRGGMIVGTEHTVELYDRATQRRTPLFSRRGEVDRVDARGAWVIAAFRDGTLVRFDRDSGREMSTTVPLDPGERLYVQVLLDGRACYARGQMIRCWGRDGSTSDEVALPDNGHVALGFNNRLLFVTADYSAYLVDIARRELRSTIPPTEWFSLAPHYDLGLFQTGQNGVEMVDLVDGSHWQAVAGGYHVLRRPMLSDDATIMFGMVENAHLVAWDVAVPSDAAATARWLDELTNATAEHGTAALSWK